MGKRVDKSKAQQPLRLTAGAAASSLEASGNDEQKYQCPACGFIGGIDDFDCGGSCCEVDDEISNRANAHRPNMKAANMPSEEWGEDRGTWFCNKCQFEFKPVALAEIQRTLF